MFTVHGAMGGIAPRVGGRVMVMVSGAAHGRVGKGLNGGADAESFLLWNLWPSFDSKMTDVSFKSSTSGEQVLEVSWDWKLPEGSFSQSWLLPGSFNTITLEELSNSTLSQSDTPIG